MARIFHCVVEASCSAFLAEQVISMVCDEHGEFANPKDSNKVRILMNCDLQPFTMRRMHELSSKLLCTGTTVYTVKLW